MAITIATESNIILQCIIITKNFLLTTVLTHSVLYWPFGFLSKFRKIYEYLLFIGF